MATTKQFSVQVIEHTLNMSSSVTFLLLDSSWGSMPGQMIPPLPPTNPQQAPPPPPPEDSMPMSEAEREFDKQFKEWEAKFAVWKEENKNHPDKVGSQHDPLV